MTILLKRGAGDPDRVTDAICVLRPSRLDEVADAVVAYVASGGTAVYVERRDDWYRWSPASRGGGYPLLRVVARFLGCEHYEITICLVSVDGWGIVDADPTEPRWRQYVVLENLPNHPRAAADAIAAGLPDD